MSPCLKGPTNMCVAQLDSNFSIQGILVKVSKPLYIKCITVHMVTTVSTTSREVKPCEFTLDI